MSPRLIFAIVFIEGYCSLGAEIIALRRLIPHIGSSIVVTAPTIGFFLLALALGYHAGSRVVADYRAVVARNFLISATLMGTGLAGSSVDSLFAHAPVGIATLFFIGGILCPLAWLLGQTVPILTNLMRTQRSGEAAGRALYWSTLGSFLGSLTLSLGMMQAFGVWSAVLLGTLLLLAGALMTKPPQRLLPGGLLAGLAVLTLVPSLYDRHRLDTAYADYQVKEVGNAGMQQPRVFFVNNQVASLIDDSTPPQYARYIRHLRQILLDELGFKNRHILVLGAGGFTLSHREPANRYTYVDIDPAIRTIAEQQFLHEAIRGDFIVADARRFVRETSERYDAVVVDVYSALTAIPAHLVTREFWRDTQRALKPDGLLLANLILDGQLATPYARNLLASIESVYGRCSVEVLNKAAEASNVIVGCRHQAGRPAAEVYVDERNRADVDRADSLR